MTWILGSAVAFGYGALVADVRAVWPNGDHLDVLQKVYPVGQWMMAGFAGSVEFGFSCIDDMQTQFATDNKNAMWMPEFAAWKWHRRARRAFAESSDRVRQLGSSLLLVGVSPFRNGPFYWTRCLRMRSPHFVPERCPPRAWLSIGTGADHELAQEFANLDFDGDYTISKMEVQNPGGSAQHIAQVVSMRLHDRPLSSVSEQLLVASAWPRKLIIRMTDGKYLGGGWSKWADRDVDDTIAQSWEQFRAMAAENGLTAAAEASA